MANKDEVTITSAQYDGQGGWHCQATISLADGVRQGPQYVEAAEDCTEAELKKKLIAQYKQIV